jgi:hypothetical protein
MSRAFRFRSHRKTGIFRDLVLKSGYDEQNRWYDLVPEMENTPGNERSVYHGGDTSLS